VLIYNNIKIETITCDLKMSSRRVQSRRKKRRSGNAPMPLAGAGLMRFFEDSSIGIKVGPIATVIFAMALILIVVFAWLGVFNWLFA
jgi:preprotein translocase subunit Sec61beta